jgi:rhodanese-related sulfurtransferase
MYPFKLVTIEEFERDFKDRGSYKIIDVREDEELEVVSTPLADHYPLSSFDPQKIATSIPKETKLFILCRSGARSKRAALILCQDGFQDVSNLEGGIMAWEARGLPVNRE